MNREDDAGPTREDEAGGTNRAGGTNGQGGERARPPDAASGIEETPGRDPGAIDRERDPHHVLNNPAGDPDPTEWPDPYDRREDPRFPGDAGPAEEDEEPHTTPGSLSTSEPHPHVEPPERENLDD